MSVLRTYIQEVEVNEPKNLQDLTIKINHDSNSDTETVSGLQFEYFNESAKILNIARRSSVGVFEGVPFRIELDSQLGFKKDIVNGYIDLWGAEYANNSILADVIIKGGIDDLNDKIDSVSAEYLDSLGLLTYVQVPYCISKTDSLIDELIAISSIYFIVDKIDSELGKLAELAIESANPFEASSIVRASMRLIYVATLMASLKTYSIQVFLGVVQPVKYHAGINAFDYLKIGCKYLGFDFRSSIFESGDLRNMVVLPKKYSFDSTGNLSPNNSDKGYPGGLFGDFFRAMVINFNARVVVKDYVIYFEKKDFRLGTSTFQLPNLLDSKDEFKYNKQDFASTIEISYAYDLQDKNTIRELTGTIYQINQLPNAITDKKLQIGKGLKNIQIPFALGKRKESLNIVEEIFDAFFELANGIVQLLVDSINLVIDALNFIIDLINDLLDLPIIGDLFDFDIPQIPQIKIENFGNLIENRIGYLKLESDNFNVDKLIILDSNKKILNLLSAKYLFDNFYYFESFAKNNNYIGNQYLLRKFDKIKFSVKDFEKIVDNKFMLDGQGNEAEILTLDYNPIQETATGTYRTHQRYLENIKIETIEPNGK